MRSHRASAQTTGRGPRPVRPVPADPRPSLSCSPRSSAVGGFLNRRALVRATRAVPRTLHFVGNALRRGEVSESLPAPHLSLGLAAQVAMDEALLAMAMAPNRFPLPGDYGRVAERVGRRRGDVRHPRLGGRPGLLPPDSAPTGATGTSPPPADGRSAGVRPGSWESGFAPHVGEPGSSGGWASGPTPRRRPPCSATTTPPGRGSSPCTGSAWGSRSWTSPGLHAARLHHELGMNVALPVLPLHGARRVTRVSGEPFLSFELMNAVHGLAQAVWDIRRLISWIRSQGATLHQPVRRVPRRVHGGATGRYRARARRCRGRHPRGRLPRAVPRGTAPRHIRARAIEHRIMGGTAENVYRVVSPLCFDPLVAATGGTSSPATATGWPHPTRPGVSPSTGPAPPVSWYAGNHVGYMWSRQVKAIHRGLAGGRGRARGRPTAGARGLTDGDDVRAGRQVPLLGDPDRAHAHHQGRGLGRVRPGGRILLRDTDRGARPAARPAPTLPPPDRAGATRARTPGLGGGPATSTWPGTWSGPCSTPRATTGRWPPPSPRSPASPSPATGRCGPSGWWRAWPGDRIAVVVKLHHAVADGSAAVALLQNVVEAATVTPGPAAACPTRGCPSRCRPAAGWWPGPSASTSTRARGLPHLVRSSVASARASERRRRTLRADAPDPPAPHPEDVAQRVARRRRAPSP